ncbi:DUF1906 domain-containing protein [Oceanobacillus sp. SE10311]
MDEMVLQTQKWLNHNYSGVPGYNDITEDGYTGQQTVRALIRALQIELDIYPTSDNFGPETMRRFPGLRRQEPGAEPTNLNFILQGGFWCKGYDPGGFSGNFFAETEDGVKRFQRDVGIDPSGVVDGKLMKAILNTDGFELSRPNGRERVRTVQQVLNYRYNNYFDYIPTNGIFERQTNRALIYALQHEIGLGSIANGNYGPSTIANTPTLSPDYAPQALTAVLQYALVCNGPEYDTYPYDGRYTSLVQTKVSEFQQFMRLPDTGIADMPTIKQLLTSNGYTGRIAIAADASTILDMRTAEVLRDNGYGIIGRYLTGTVGGVRSKAMTRQEIAVINHYGLRVFPIYQDGGWYASYFNAAKGEKDAIIAMNKAYELGFPPGTTIYFAVDYDAYDFEVQNNVIPYMASIRRVFDSHRTEDFDYKVGVYGARNTCIQCMNDSSVRADHSFVANMSTGFSGNLGFPMPTNWSFGQFFETDIYANVNGESVTLRIDKNDYSGLDQGAQYIQPRSSKDPEYEALHEAWADIGINFPILKDKGLFTKNFAFNQTYQVYRSAFVDIDVSTSTTYTVPGDVESVAFTIENGEIKASMREMLGEMYGEISSDRLADYQQMVNNLSATIGNGFLSITYTQNPSDIVIDVTVYKENIEIEGGNSIDLAITVSYKFKNPFVIDFEPVLVALGISLAVVAFGAIVYLTLPALGGVTAIATIVRLLVGAFAR